MYNKRLSQDEWRQIYAAQLDKYRLKLRNKRLRKDTTKYWVCRICGIRFEVRADSTLGSQMDLHDKAMHPGIMHPW